MDEFAMYLRFQDLAHFFSGSSYGSSCLAANDFLYLNISPEINARYFKYMPVTQPRVLP